MKQFFCILFITLQIFILSCSGLHNGTTDTTKTLHNMIGSYTAAVFNPGTISVADGGISISKNISNYGHINIMINLTEEQMQSVSESLVFENVLGKVGSMNETFQDITLKIKDVPYDESHGYTGTDTTYTQIECIIKYTDKGKPKKETFIVHNAECCSVNTKFNLLFGR